MKGHQPFQNPYFEVLAYTQDQIDHWSRLQKNRGRQSKLLRSTILRHLQNTKVRILSAIQGSCSASYGDRQEYRILLATLEAMPEDTTNRIQPSQDLGTSTHYGFWRLATQHVAEFRIAECNRWLLALEKTAQLAEFVQGTSCTLSLVEQEMNSLVSIAVSCLLYFLIGYLNPEQLPSVWKGKRWVKSRFQNNFQNTVLHPEPTLQKRQGLDIQSSVLQYGMSWLPHNLATWGTPAPTFYINKYPHLEIGTNALRATLRTSTTLLTTKTKAEKI